jgi:hypothetical protein
MPTKPRTKTTRSTRAARSKEETMAKFGEVAQELAERAPEDTQAAEREKLRVDEIRQSVEGLSVEQVVQQLSGLSVGISRALSSVSEQLVEQVQELETVREVVRLERAELERLHGTDVAATALHLLVAEHEARRQKLEAEQAAQRALWDQEQKQRDTARREQEETLRKTRQREAEEYEYQKSIERKKAQDSFAEEMAHLEKQNREKQEALEKSWQQREAALKGREEELAALKKEVDTFPARSKREVDVAVSSALGAAKKEHDAHLQMLTKETEGERRLAALQIKSLEETLAKQNAQMADLQGQLQLAKQQVQEIALRALESAAGAKTLEEIRQFAREQSKREAK